MNSTSTDDHGAMTAAALVAAARQQVRTLTPDQLSAELDTTDAVLVDVREHDELVNDGTIPGAIPLPRGMLEFHADPTSPYHHPDLRPDRPVILYCRSGARSALAATALHQLGYHDVAHLHGGYLAWNDSGRPISTSAPTPPPTGLTIERFARALIAKDRAALDDVLHPAVDFAGLTPGRAWTASSAAELIDDVLFHWIEPDDHITAIVELHARPLADLQTMTYRLTIDNPTGTHLVEQNATATVSDEQITKLRMMCSGFRPTPD